MPVNTTGKISLDHIYTEPDPRAYFSTLRHLEYQIPQLAKPHFSRLIQEYRESQEVLTPTVLDIGCSYGINAALLKCDVSMDDLYERYGTPAAAELTRGELLALDRALVDRPGARVEFAGLDASDPALGYAEAAGFLDETVHADLENRDPSPAEAERLARADIVISTGCLGYVTEKTIKRVVDAAGPHKPWMAHFVLRMFPFDPIADALAAAGYQTVRHEGLFKQRKFATDDEQANVVQRLESIGIDPGGLESDGWFYAQLFVSRP